MKNSLLFYFNVDKQNKTVVVTREFNANLNSVWEAWTKAQVLDQWWAPKPWSSRTKFMDFKVGGRRFYAMVSPDGKDQHWSVQKYTSITPQTNFKFMSAFADKDENMNLPGSDWDLTFSEYNGKTKVVISIYNESLERMEQMIEMGFVGGFTMCLENLDELFSQSK